MNPPSLHLHKRLFRPGAYPQPPASLAEDFAFHLLVDLEEARAEGLTDAALIAERYGVPVEMVHIQGTDGLHNEESLMADRKTERDIKKLRRCIEEVKDLNPSKVQYKHQSVKDIASDIETTLIDVFGEDSQEHKNNRLLLFPSILGTMSSDAERQETFPGRITHTVKRLKELIEDLKEKREDPEAEQGVEQSGATSSANSSANTRRVEDAQEVDQSEAPFPAKQYEVALSFAGEQREYVEQVAGALQSRRIAVFYDGFEKVSLWGKHGTEEFNEVLEHRAALAVMFISKEYVEKAWPRHERQSILSRGVRERGEYVLPVRFDNTSVPGLPADLIYLNAEDYAPAELAAMIAEKLGIRRFAGKASQVPPPRMTSPAGEVVFDYSSHNGHYIIGRGQLEFETQWSKASDRSIYVLNDPDSINGVAVAKGCTSIAQVINAESLDYTSHYRTPQRGEIVVLRNVNDFYAAVHVLEIKDDTRDDDRDELRFRYAIQGNGSDNFAEFNQDVVTKSEDGVSAPVPTPTVREDRVREVSRVANKVVEATRYVDELGNKLKVSYDSLFAQANMGGGSAHTLAIDEVDKKKETIGPMQQAAQAVLDEGPQKLADEQITERLLELGGYQVRLDRVRDKFNRDLASVEAQFLSYQKNKSY